MTTAPQRLVVDTDMGVDDAAAIAWLLHQKDFPLEVIGLSAVWGNSSVENVTGNILALLAALHRSDIPVVMGEGKPLRGKRLGLGAMTHGHDGLWGHGRPFPPNFTSEELVAWYERLADQYGGATLLTLGPLTNLARLLDDAPAVLHRFANIVILGGSRYGGSLTPTAETNIWQDPEAAHRVFSAGLPLTLVTRDAHTMFSIAPADLDAIASGVTAAAKFIAKPLLAYAMAQGKVRPAVSCADVVAAMVAVDASIATTTQRGLVKIVTVDEPLVRGQSVMGFSPFEKIPMIEPLERLAPIVHKHLTDPSFDFDAALVAILAREPDNADVVLAVDAHRIKETFMRTMTGNGGA